MPRATLRSFIIPRLVGSSSLLAFVFSLAGCASNPIEDFKQVRKGQMKDEVIDIMGSPHRTQRRSGQDRWTYVHFNENDVKVENEVHFEEGLAVYVGPPPTPEVSADEQDALNERANTAADAEAKVERASTVQDYEEYQRKMKTPQPAKPLPTFSEIQ